jgi:plastocyanin
MSDKGRSNKWRYVAAAFMLAGLMACGDGDDGGGSGGPTTPSGGAPGPSGATITIGTNGAVSPASVTITTGQSVTVVNNHSAAHQIASDPHPAHTNCPSINALGSIPPNTTRLTNAFTGTGTCTFHDHNEPTNAALMGTVRIQ